MARRKLADKKEGPQTNARIHPASDTNPQNRNKKSKGTKSLPMNNVDDVRNDNLTEALRDPFSLLDLADTLVNLDEGSPLPSSLQTDMQYRFDTPYFDSRFDEGEAITPHNLPDFDMPFEDKLIKASSDPTNHRRNKKTRQERIRIRLSHDVYHEIMPELPLRHLTIADDTLKIVREIIDEQKYAKELRSRNVPIRRKLLISGPPKNGKTSLAEAIAFELGYPLIVLRYELIVGGYFDKYVLGKIFEEIVRILAQASTKHCVLLLDEFDTFIRSQNEYPVALEVRRFLHSLILQGDLLSDHTIVVAACTYPKILDSTVRQRFDWHIEMSAPTQEQLVDYLSLLMRRSEMDFGYTPQILAEYLRGLSFGEIEEFCYDIVRHATIHNMSENAMTITQLKLKEWEHRLPSNIPSPQETLPLIPLVEEKKDYIGAIYHFLSKHPLYPKNDLRTKAIMAMAIAAIITWMGTLATARPSNDIPVLNDPAIANILTGKKQFPEKDDHLPRPDANILPNKTDRK